jgi:hemerythrin superfamily protein
MNSLLKRWFGRGGHADRTSASQYISAVRPRGDFRPDLIPTLQAEHRELLSLFENLERSSEQGDEPACRAALDRFTRVLQDHLLTENRHLYGYFSRHTDPDPDVARQVEAMSSDMMRVGKILHRFITTYTRATWSSALQAQLRKDLPPIGEVLVHRIHEEESVLYPLYTPHPT